MNPNLKTQLQNAEGASRTLDGEIEVFIAEYKSRFWKDAKKGGSDDFVREARGRVPRHFTSSLDAITELVKETVGKDRCIVRTYLPKAGYPHRIYIMRDECLNRMDRWPHPTLEGNTERGLGTAALHKVEALAACIALLTALEGGEDHG